MPKHQQPRKSSVHVSTSRGHSIHKKQNAFPHTIHGHNAPHTIHGKHVHVHMQNHTAHLHAHPKPHMKIGNIFMQVTPSKASHWHSVLKVGRGV